MSSSIGDVPPGTGHRSRRRIAVVVAALTLAGLLTWQPWRGAPGDPFPSLGWVDAGVEVPHAVTDLGATSGDGLEVTTWDGSLTIDPELALSGELSDDGTRTSIVATGQGDVGAVVSTARSTAWLFDLVGDGVIDVAVFRVLRDGPGPELAAHSSSAFAIHGSHDIVVTRPQFGHLAQVYEVAGIRGVVCEGGYLPAGDPATPEEAEALDADRTRTAIWCHRPFQRAVPAADPTLDVDQIEGDVEAGGEPRGIRRQGPSPAPGDAERLAARSGPVLLRRPAVTAAFGFFGDTPCDEVEERNDETRDVLDEVPERMEQLAKLAAEVQKVRAAAGEGFDLVEELRNAPDGKHMDVVRGWLGEAALSEAESAKEAQFDAFYDESWAELFGTFDGPAGEHMDGLRDIFKDLPSALRGGPAAILDWIKSMHEWAAGVAETLADLLDQQDDDCDDEQACIDDPTLEACAQEPDGASPSDDSSSARSKGEPHITTFDGLSYGFQAVGEYVLVRGEEIEVQARYQNIRDSVSVTVAVAVRLPGTDQALSVTVDDALDDAGWIVHLDEQPFVVEAGPTVVGDYRLTLEGGQLTVETDGRASVRLQRMIASRPLFNIVDVTRFDRSAPLAGGILGNDDGDPSNDYLLPDGTVLEPITVDFDTLYKVFGEAWRLKTVEESLFHYTGDDGPETFHNPRLPAGEVTLATLTREQLERGLGPCLAAGVWVEPALSDCAFDVAVTDEALWVETGTQAQQTLPTAPLPLALPGGLLTESGTYVLWEGEGFRVTALVAGEGTRTRQGAPLVVRGLLVEVGSDTELVYPGWQPAPTTLELGRGRSLHLFADGDVSVVPELVGSPDGVTGLATETARPDERTGVALLGPEQAARWSADWLRGA